MMKCFCDICHGEATSLQPRQRYVFICRDKGSPSAGCTLFVSLSRDVCPTCLGQLLTESAEIAHNKKMVIS